MSEAIRSEPEAPEFDLFKPLRSAGTLDDPYPIYSLLRSVRPVLEVPVEEWDGPGVWLLTRYRDVQSVLRDSRFSVNRLQAPLFRDNLDRLPAFVQQATGENRSMLVTDAPDHTRVRKLVNQAFTPKRIAKLRAHIQQIVDDLLDTVAEKGEMDLIHDFAEPIPAVVIAELLGVPPSDHRKFREWSSQIIAGAAARTMEERRNSGGGAMLSLLAYLRDTIAARREEPRADLISGMIQAQEERDALTDGELLANANLLLIAGHETTTNLIGNGTLALLRAPEQLERLRSDPSLLPSAIEELLRFDPPVQMTVRAATEDVAIDEHVIPKGALVLVSLGAANHDPETFSNPGRLDIARDPNPHVSFGFGAHFCLGAQLARLEAEVALGSLVTRLPELALVTDAPAYRENPILRGLKALPVVF